jgi:hypothetical protein
VTRGEHTVDCGTSLVVVVAKASTCNRSTIPAKSVRALSAADGALGTLIVPRGLHELCTTGTLVVTDPQGAYTTRTVIGSGSGPAPN